MNCPAWNPSGLVLACVAALSLFSATPIFAQHQTGNLSVVVQDQAGNPISDVAVTLEGAKVQGFQLRDRTH